jgi:putative ABC transport system substrate-binding protein
MASAQQLARAPRVIHLAPVDIPAQADGTRRLLSGLGYVDGRNIRLEFRSAAGNVDALPALAQELVQQGGVDVIIAISTPAALAAYKATHYSGAVSRSVRRRDIKMKLGWQRAVAMPKEMMG